MNIFQKRTVGKKGIAAALLASQLLFTAGCGSGEQRETAGQLDTEQTMQQDGYIVVGYVQVGSESDWRTTNTQSFKDVFTQENGYYLIGEDGEQLGIMSARDAMKLAREADLDLVKIAPNAKPPVCKIVDYGKYRYELARREKEAKKKQRTMEVKEIRLSPNIDVNDLNTKANQARKFLSKGDRVKVSLRFRGRELAHINYSKQILDSFYEKLEDIAVVDKPAKMEGRTMVMFLSEKRQ